MKNRYQAGLVGSLECKGTIEGDGCLCCCGERDKNGLNAASVVSYLEDVFIRTSINSECRPVPLKTEIWERSKKDTCQNTFWGTSV